VNRRRRRQRLRALLLLAVALAGTALALVAYERGVMRRIELDTVDARFVIRGHEPPPRDILIVAIDDESFRRLVRRFGEWPRTWHARVLRRLKRAGAKVIAYDVQFSEDSGNRDADIDLAQAVFDARPVVLAATQTDAGGRTNLLGGPRIQKLIQARPGNALLPDDPGRVLRRVEPEVGGLKAFSVVTVEAERGRPQPRPPAGRDLWIDYSGPRGTYPQLSFARVLEEFVPKRLVRGRTVIVGPTAETLHDVHATPFDDMPGAEVQANAIATARAGFPLRSVRDGWNVALIVLLGTLAPLTSLAMAPLRALLLAAVAGAVFVAGAQVAFQSGEVVAVTYPLLAGALSAFGSVTVYYFTEVRERRRMRALFSRFVPESVVDQVVERADEDLRIGGTTIECTVLFSDLRGFTTFSEPLTATTVIEVLNLYLGEMSEAILDHGGTLVSYMGDGIMAVFGAPIELDDHADRALAASREMLGARLPRFNQWLVERGLGEGFRMGIGLNSGPVMSGNVGSERRVEYTAVGDTTNTASRLEGITKEAGCQLLVAESTLRKLRRPPTDLELVGEFAVRGREEGIRAWTLRAERGGDVKARTQPLQVPDVTE